MLAVSIPEGAIEGCARTGNALATASGVSIPEGAIEGEFPI